MSSSMETPLHTTTTRDLNEALRRGTRRYRRPIIDRVQTKRRRAVSSCMLLNSFRRTSSAWGARGFSSTCSRRAVETPRKPRVIFSGIQPTGIPHVRFTLELNSRAWSTFVQLGNFLGALQNWVRLQQDAHPEDVLIYSIVGWHSLTLPQNPRALAVARREMLAALLAIGLDPKRVTLFHQDDVR